MKVFAYVLMGVLGGAGLVFFFTGPSSQNFLSSPMTYAMPAPETEDVKPWTGNDLLEMAQLYDQQADELQSEAVRIEQRAASLMLKPHMDPKGFHRTMLMHVASARWKSARELRDLAVMHRQEGQRLLAFKSPEGP
ncbi:hypothetical protein [Candidatus Nitrospira neomarina]|uniref:Uncharacterized protein n=1 Tax=Candidatus Nitrospira neomarina TaxID=3020899 RepID=A0AA96GFT2_9BACT|nr:hypothetical protein [Candidatus Nitrospira neomarina]WNM60257.1 hypothetical protein PQG83_10825 [Candidatus Nitrospira neomarina]